MQNHMINLTQLLLKVGVKSRIGKVQEFSDKTKEQMNGENNCKIYVDSTSDFCSKIGFRYCRSKAIRAEAIASFESLCVQILNDRESILNNALKLHRNGSDRISSYEKSVEEYKSSNIIIHPYCIPTIQVFYSVVRTGNLPDGLTYIKGLNLRDYLTEIGAIEFFGGHAEGMNRTEDTKLMSLKLISIKSSGKSHVYDISVNSNTESFLANGIGVHNCITPGTVFMFNMTNYLDYSIRKEMNGFSLWKNLEIIFSPPTVPSEGEHKILDYMRTLPSDVIENESHCIYGPDGDLIMLTLASHIPNMFLLREDQYTVEHFDLLDMGQIRTELPKFMGQPETRSHNDVTDDFIFQGFFVGNDFLPKIQMFYRLEDGLEKMISTYRQVITNTTDSIKQNLVIDGELNLQGFYEFVSLLAEEEEYYLSQQALIKAPKEKFVNQTLLNNIKIDEKNNHTLDFKGYRQDYYAKMGIDLKEKGYKKKIRGLCHSYIKTLIWIFEYYIKGLPAWRWAYEYHYAPLMYDLSRHLSMSIVNGDTYDFDYESSSVPFEQLLSVLPVASAELIPNPYRKLMVNKSSELVKSGYYPEQFDVDYEGKDKDFQGVVLLPFVDYSLVHKCYEKMKEHVKTRYVRNQLGKNIVYWYDPKYKAMYTSDVGSIKNLHVRSKEVDPLRV